jgi:DNA-binding response OmpR family regulator
MLTAKGQEVDRDRGQEVGADEYVTKPFDPDYIIDRAQAVLGILLEDS